MGPLQRPQPLPGAWELEHKPLELLQVQCRQRLQPPLPVAGQLQTHEAMILGVTHSPDQTSGIGAIDQPDHAVMTQEQVVGDLSDRRSLLAAMASDRQQQLMLRGGEAGRTRLLLAPAQEMT